MAVIARGSHSFTCHPLTNHTCLYFTAAGHHCSLAGTCKPNLHLFIFLLMVVGKKSTSVRRGLHWRTSCIYGWYWWQIGRGEGGHHGSEGIWWQTGMCGGTMSRVCSEVNKNRVHSCFLAGGHNKPGCSLFC